MFKFLKPVFLLLAIYLIAGCSTAGDATEAAAVAVSSPPTPTNTAESLEMVSTSGETAPTEVQADYCLACHTDKQRLVDTAKPEEEAISENKGEG